MTSGSAYTKTFDWTDPLDLKSRLTEEEVMISEVARVYAREKLLPRVVSAFSEERFDREIMSEMGELGLLGATLPEEYGGAGAGHVAYGLIAREVEAVDSGYRSAMSVQSSLAMFPIYAFGSEEQKKEFLPKMARGDLIGCFGLTESEGGSDPAAMRTKAVKVDGGYVLNGGKYWITNSPISDLAVVWAKLDGDINGFIVERAFEGFTTNVIGDKLSLRASVTGDIGLADVFVPEENRLPGVVAAGTGEMQGWAARLLRVVELLEVRPVAASWAPGGGLVPLPFALCIKALVRRLEVAMWDTLEGMLPHVYSARCGRALKVSLWGSSRLVYDVVHLLAVVSACG